MAINPDQLPRTAVDALGIGDRAMLGARPHELSELDFAIAAQRTADKAGLHYQADVVKEVLAGGHIQVAPITPAVGGLVRLSEPTRLPSRF